MQWMNRFSYHRRLQFSFLALILLPFAAVTFWSYQSVRQNVSDKILRTNEETITVIANQIEKQSTAFPSHPSISPKHMIPKS